MANETQTTQERTAPGAPPSGAAGNGNRGDGQVPTASAPQDQAAAPKAPMDPGKRRLLLIGAVIVLILGIIYGVRFYEYSQTHVATDDAYVTGNTVNISPIIAGTLSQVNVQEGDRVKKGQLIARLDDSGPQASLQQALAAYKAALSQVPQAEINLSYEKQANAAAIRRAQAALATQAAKTQGAQSQTTLTASTVRNQLAQAGQQLEVARAQAQQADSQVKIYEASARTARQAITTAQRGANATTANISAAQANFQKAKNDELRYRRLLAQQAVTQQQYDTAYATLRSAQAQLTATQEQSGQGNSQVAQTRSQAQQAAAQLQASRDAARAAHQQVGVAQAAVEIARANLSQVGIQQSNVTSNITQGSQAQADLAAAQAGAQQISLRKAQIDTAQNQAEQEKAAYENAKIVEQDTYLYAPADGEVIRKSINPGAALSPGQTIITMSSGNDVWVTANFKETQLRDVQVGQPAEVEVDTFPGVIFQGKVLSINNATGASTALLPPDNATGNFTKVVQRIPLRIALIPAKKDESKQYARETDIQKLRQGMSVTATVNTVNAPRR